MKPSYMKKLLTYLVLMTILLTSTLYATPDCTKSLKTQDFVQRFYAVILGREADNAGMDDWTNQLLSRSATGATIAQGFIFSAEYNIDSKSNTQYINDLYAAFFNRPADTDGFNHWMTQLNGGTPKEVVLDGFLHSAEFINLSNSYGIQAYEGAAFESTEITNFVQRLYSIILGRVADNVGLLHWTNKLSTGENTGADIAKGFIFSAEYNIDSKSNTQYLNDLYAAFTNRTADPAGFSDWMGKLNSGTSRSDILDGFISSQEFINLTNSYGVLAFTSAAQSTSNNTAPVAVAGANQNAFLGQTVNLSGSASSDSDGTLSCYWWKEGSTLLATTENFSKSDFGIGAHTLTLTVVDDAGVSATDSVDVTVIDVTVVDVTAPVITITGGDTVTVSQNSSYTEVGATAFDTVDGTVSVTSTGTVDVSIVGNYIITYTATDAAGNTATATKTVTVVDVTAPIITIIPGSSTIEVDSGSYVDPGATAIDVVDGIVPVITSGGVDAHLLGSYTVIYTATDAAGNTATAHRFIQVVDTQAPVITITGGNTVTVPQNSSYTDAGATATDNVDGTVSVTTIGTVDTSTLGNYIITYTATDAASNTATATRTVTVGAAPDTLAPVITVIPVNGFTHVTIVQNTPYTDAGATAIDNVDGNVTVITTGVVDQNTSGDYNITYTATDIAGNMATATRTVTVSSSTITHNGITYGKVTSPYTGRIWLDRNVGATEVCTSFNDAACYGSYYQWGRNTDGHQDYNSTTTNILAADINNAGTDYILVNTNINADDWATNIQANRASVRSTNWKKTDGSFVCPIGFQVPTQQKLSLELLDAGSAQIHNRTDAFNSFLKLPSAGYRNHTDGSRVYVGTKGYLWQSGATGNYSNYTYFTDTTASFYDFGRQSRGMPIRCVKQD